LVRPHRQHLLRRRTRVVARPGLAGVVSIWGRGARRGGSRPAPYLSPDCRSRVQAQASHIIPRISGPQYPGAPLHGELAPAGMVWCRMGAAFCLWAAWRRSGSLAGRGDRNVRGCPSLLFCRQARRQRLDILNRR
jgi:hypothetical protein